VASIIPDKIFFKIGEVADIVGVKPHVLRYWETEFSTLKPVKSRTNQRLYRREDIEQALRIKTLLYQQGFTVSGARQQLKQKPAASCDNQHKTIDLDSVLERLRRLRDRLQQDIEKADR
jgi:DNA-binding transcriptional MerR regulator